MVAPTASTICDKATAMPNAAVNRIEAAVVSPSMWPLDLCLMMVPAPRKLTPVMIAPTMRTGSERSSSLPSPTPKCLTTTSPIETRSAAAPVTST